MSNATYQGYDFVKFDRIASTTLAKHIKELEMAHMRQYPFPAQLQAGGKVLTNQGGRGFDWPVQFTIHDGRTSTGANVRDWKSKNLFTKAWLEYRGYEALDTISKAEVLANKDSESALVNLMDGFLDRIKQSLEIWLSRQYFNDGNTNTEWWHGLETLFANNGTINYSTGAQQAKTAADIVAYPAATYAGLSTELSAKGGSQIDGVWPQGMAEPARDYWSPVILFGDSSNLAVTNSELSTTHTWQAQCLEIIGFAVTHSMRFGGLDQRLSTILMDRTMFNELKNRVRGKEQVWRGMGQEDTSLLKLGFADTMVVDGCEITMDAGLPNNTAYGFNWRNCELRCQTAEMFDTESGVWYDPDVSAHKAVVSTLSNLRFTGVRNFVKIVKNVSQLT